MGHMVGDVDGEDEYFMAVLNSEDKTADVLREFAERQRCKTNGSSAAHAGDEEYEARQGRWNERKHVKKRMIRKTRRPSSAIDMYIHARDKLAHFRKHAERA